MATDNYDPNSGFVNPYDEKGFDIAAQIRRSPAFRAAWDLFQQEPDKIWLQRLNSIPERYSQSYTPDHIGFGSNSIQQKNSALFNEAMAEVESLVEQYQEYVQKLPINQRQQLADAGIYDASGITGSSLNPGAVNAGSASQMQVDQPYQILSTLGQFALNASTGLASTVQSFLSLGLESQKFGFEQDKFSRTQDFTEQHAFNALKQWATEKGFSIPEGGFGESDWKVLTDSGWHDPNLSWKESKSIIDGYLQSKQYGKLYSYILSTDPDIAGYMPNAPIGPKGDQRFSLGYSTDIAPTISKIGKAMYDYYTAELEHQSILGKVNRSNQLETANEGFQLNMSIKRSEKNLKKVEENKANILNGLIGDLKEDMDKGDIVATVALMDMFAEISPATIAGYILNRTSDSILGGTIQEVLVDKINNL